MTMNITSKQMEITPAIRQHVADRLAKLENRLPFFYSISDATEMISLQRIQSNMACFQPFLK